MEPIILTYFAQSDNHDYLEKLQLENQAISDAWNQIKKEGVDKKFYFSVSHMNRGFTKREDVINDIQHYTNEQFVLFHFGGHAGNQELSFVDGSGHADGLAELLGKAKNLKLVFLNGCATYSLVELLFKNGIKAVIATNHTINDKKAQMFAEYFYQELSKRGTTIREAYKTAKAAIKFSTKSATEEPIVWRGFVTGKCEDKNLWQLHVKEEFEWVIDDPNWWVIGNRVLSENKDKKEPKLYFIYDQKTKNEYEDIFKDALLSRIENKKVFINSTLENGESNINPIHVQAEIEAADIIFIQIKNNSFRSFFKSLNLEKENFIGKILVPIKIEDPEESLNYLMQNGIKYNYTFPKEELSMTTQDFNSSKKIKELFIKNFESFLGDSEEKLAYLSNFNFSSQKECIESISDQSSKLFFKYVEGTEQCGIKILLTKVYNKFNGANLFEGKVLLKYKPILNLDELKEEIAFQSSFEKDLFASLWQICNNNRDIILHFDHLYQFNNSESQLNEKQAMVFLEFFKELKQSFEGKINNRILMIVCSRNFNGTSLFSTEEIKKKRNEMNVTDCEPIKPVKKNDIIDWKQNIDPLNKRLSDINPDEIEKKIGQSLFVSPVITAMGTQLSIPKTKLLELLND